jgi:hypothetical protein
MTAAHAGTPNPLPAAIVSRKPERPVLYAETEELIEEAWLHHYEVIE